MRQVLEAPCILKFIYIFKKSEPHGDNRKLEKQGNIINV